jgi:hypothetical protein
MKEQLKKILPENRVDEFLSIGKERSMKANDYFVKAGETPIKIAYVLRVCFAMFI